MGQVVPVLENLPWNIRNFCDDFGYVDIALTAEYFPTGITKDLNVGSQQFL